MLGYYLNEKKKKKSYSERIVLLFIFLEGAGESDDFWNRNFLPANPLLLTALSLDLKSSDHLLCGKNKDQRSRNSCWTEISPTVPCLALVINCQCSSKATYCEGYSESGVCGSKWCLLRGKRQLFHWTLIVGFLVYVFCFGLFVYLLFFSW